MSDTNNRPNQDASLRGDDKAMPDRGTSVGWHGADPQLDGAATDAESINRKGRITGATGSDSESTPFGGETTI